MAERFASWERRYPPEVRAEKARGSWTAETLAAVRQRAEELEARVCELVGVAPADVRRLEWTRPRAAARAGTPDVAAPTAPLGYYWGDDSYGVARGPDALAARLAGGGPALDRVRLSGSSTSADEIAEKVATATMFGGGTLVVVAEPAPLVVNKPLAARLVAVFDAVADGNGLAFLDLVDGTARRPASLEALRNAVAAAGGDVREFKAPTREGMARWISDRAAERGIRIAGACGRAAGGTRRRQRPRTRRRSPPSGRAGRVGAGEAGPLPPRRPDRPRGRQGSRRRRRSRLDLGLPRRRRHAPRGRGRRARGSPGRRPVPRPGRPPPSPPARADPDRRPARRRHARGHTGEDAQAQPVPSPRSSPIRHGPGRCPNWTPRWPACWSWTPR